MPNATPVLGLVQSIWNRKREQHEMHQAQWNNKVRRNGPKRRFAESPDARDWPQTPGQLTWHGLRSEPINVSLCFLFSRVTNMYGLQPRLDAGPVAKG